MTVTVPVAQLRGRNYDSHKCFGHALAVAVLPPGESLLVYVIRHRQTDRATDTRPMHVPCAFDWMRPV